MSSSDQDRFFSRKFMMVASINALSSMMLFANKLTSGDWVETSKWSLSSYMAANVIGDKIQFHGEKKE